jgi:hypothetical protein
VGVVARRKIKSKRRRTSRSERPVSCSRNRSSTHCRSGGSSGGGGAERTTREAAFPLAFGGSAQGCLARLLLSGPQALEAFLKPPAHPLAPPLATPQADDAERVDVLLALTVAFRVTYQAPCVTRAPPRGRAVLVVDDDDVRVRLCCSRREDRGEWLGGDRGGR